MADECTCIDRRGYLSPLRISLLAVNGVCFGGLLVLLILGRGNGPAVLAAVGAGLSLAGGLAGAILAARRLKNSDSRVGQKESG